MSEQTGERLAAALRAQASSLPAPARREPGLPSSAGVRGWVLLLTALLLGAFAGVLAALVSML